MSGVLTPGGGPAGAAKVPGIQEGLFQPSLTAFSPHGGQVDAAG